MIDSDDHGSNPAKHAKTLAQVLKDDVKTECQDPSIISTSAALAATRPLNQSIIKTEPETYDGAISFDKTPSTLSKRPTNNSNQSTLLRSLIRTPTLPTKKDAPLYDLLQNLDSNDTSIFSTINSTSSTSTASTSKTNNQQNVDPLEQYLTPAISQPSKSSTSKDDYLAALLSSDPQQPKEISFLPANKQRTPAPTQSTPTANDNNRIAAIVNDLFTSTTAAATATSNNHHHNTGVNSSNDDFLSLLDNRDFLEVNLRIVIVSHSTECFILVFK